MGTTKTPREFLLRALAWPADEDVAGFINVHCASLGPDGKLLWGGKPARTVDEFFRWSAFFGSLPGPHDIYMCMSRQAKTRISRSSKVTAAKHQKDALALKAIYLDVDVKDPPKGYASLTEALQAVAAFVKVSGLPAPTALVASGGGVHVYWISDRELSPFEWQPYANGLKALAIQHKLRCDAGITSDCARVLRVPATFNHKTTPPRPVKLLGLQDTDYEFSTTLGFLRSIAPVHVATPGLASVDWSLFPKRNEVVESLAEGIDRKELPPLDFAPLVQECAFIREALATGGALYSQPMWNLTTLAATWLDRGRALAHRMGNKHPGYTHESTEALFDRKVAERKNGDIGWPSCSAVQAAGCTSCAACPHFPDRKSPLNYAIPKETGTVNQPARISRVANQVTAAVSPIIGSPTADLPDGFQLDDDGFVCKIVSVEERGQPPRIELLKLFHCHLYNAWAQSRPSALNLTTTLDLGNIRQCSIEQIEMDSWTLYKALLKNGIKPYPPNKKYLEEFIMAWLAKLHAAQKATASVPFGWYEEDGARHGFAFGGIVMKDDGTEHPTGYGDSKLREFYKPTGQLQPWLNACKLITDQHRPDLEIVVAASFGAPLMVATGEYGGVISAWGDSGSGKSTSVKIGQSVWGHPKKTKEVTKSTTKSVVQKMGELRHLPMYWDEIKDAKSQHEVFDTTFSATEGVIGSRLNANITFQDRGDWQTLMVICSNLCFIDHVVSQQRTTTAGIYRVFEFKVPVPDSTAVGRLGTIDVSMLTQETEHNYGVIGLLYARLLATDPVGCCKLVYDIVKDMDNNLQFTAQERFWSALCGAVLAGATLANRLGTCFDVPAMQAFMEDTIRELRHRVVDEATAGGSANNVEEVVVGFLKQFVGHTVWTDRLSKAFSSGRGGRPGPIQVKFGPPPDRRVPIHIQWAVDDNKLIFSRAKFYDYMVERKILSPRQIMEGLKVEHGATVTKSTLCAGTQYRVLQERVIVIPVAAGSVWNEAMSAYGNAADTGAVIDESDTTA